MIIQEEYNNKTEWKNGRKKKLKTKYKVRVGEWLGQKYSHILIIIHAANYPRTGLKGKYLKIANKMRKFKQGDK